MAYTLLAQLDKIEQDFPRNSKALKKHLRSLDAKDLKVLYKKTNHIQDLLDRFQGPLEDEVLAACRKAEVSTPAGSW